MEKSSNLEKDLELLDIAIKMFKKGKLRNLNFGIDNHGRIWIDCKGIYTNV